MNQVKDDCVVSFFYTLKNDQGDVLETNVGGDPVVYLHGHSNMISGLEDAMSDREKDQQFEVTLDPKDAYGERQESMQMKVPVKHLQGLPKGVREWKAGMVALVETDQGARHVTVVKPGRFMVQVDMNHPLAGQTLTYEIEISDIRAADPEEIAHGHVHGAGGHHH